MRSLTALTRILLVLLSLCLVLSAFVACSAEDDEDLPVDSTEEDSNDEYLDEDLYDENGYLKDQLPDEDLDYAGKELKILCWASPANEFGCEETNGTAINDAIVKRDINVEDRLGVDLHYLTDQVFNGSVTNISHYTELVRVAAEGGTPYDLTALYGRTAAVLSSDGYMQNILDIDYSYINFENPWWTQNLLNELVVGRSLYMLSGDITPSIYEQPYILFYNQDMIKSFGLVDPYTLVKNNEWTLETFRSYTKNVTVNPNGGQGYGYTASRSNVPSIMHGCGIVLMELDADSIPRLSETLFSEKAIDIVDDLQEWAKEDAYMIAKSAAEARAPFIAEQSLFLSDRVLECLNFTGSCDFAYSVVPTPKFTAEQDRYYTTLDTQLTFFGIMKGFEQEELTLRSAVLECMASEGYRLSSPAVVETCLMSRYAQSEQMAEMLRLCVDSVYYDFGRIYSSSEDNYICDRAGIIIQAGGPETWASYKNSNKEFLENRFQALVDKFIEMENQ